MTTALDPKLMETTRSSNPAMANEAHTESAAPVLTGRACGQPEQRRTRTVQGAREGVGALYLRQHGARQLPEIGEFLAEPPLLQIVDAVARGGGRLGRVAGR